MKKEFVRPELKIIILEGDMATDGIVVSGNGAIDPDHDIGGVDIGGGN